MRGVGRERGGVRGSLGKSGGGGGWVRLWCVGAEGGREARWGIFQEVDPIFSFSKSSRLSGNSGWTDGSTALPNAKTSIPNRIQKTRWNAETSRTRKTGMNASLSSSGGDGDQNKRDARIAWSKRLRNDEGDTSEIKVGRGRKRWCYLC